MAVIAIVGGGIGGLVAAFTLKQSKPEHEVVLVESSQSLGGLLGLSHQSHGYHFDIGTHIPAETQIPQLDQWLYGAIYQDNSWSKIPRIRGAHYFRGKLDESHHNIASEEQYDLLTDGVPNKVLTNLWDDYLFRFGQSLTKNLFAPCISKFVPFALNEIEPEVKRYFALDRLSGHAGRNPQQHGASTPLAESRIDLTGKTIPLAFYPANGEGVFRWIKLLAEQLNAMGVQFLTGKKLVEFSKVQSTIKELHFADQSTLACDYLVWTAPIETLGQIAASTVYQNWAGLYQRTTIKIFHFIVDQAFLSSSHYINCFEPVLDPYRITLYDNFAGHKGDGHRCTVEVIGTRAADEGCTAAYLMSQLKEMKIIQPAANLLYQHETTIHNGFPVRKVGATAAAELMCEQLLSSYSNLSLSGSAKPGVFFSNDVMIKTYTELKAAAEAGTFL
ncbi:MAG: FAD-dependent oxidoreductase [Gammaproteobacteria bacterium]|nr:FAD-dependent oxidoreductase [Gammaproteobacteria bacterium]MBU2058382.1 FAD-dependent oxidoreductase [Gammaproteobacteria bacterium]MBU2176565.1 FAD-dependent oxidoreductase [Gammaproteobacteria bacterium]MBU2248493.1 FAD-dependent oxidoreductase [Gammaproteobacteria bacterium]MBU2345644.1 FAD-dependent oxidoreductase [Gammaproteobacteria bacterium]